MANALRDLFDDRAERVNLHDQRLRHFVQGYRSVRCLEDQDLQHLPLLTRMNNLVLFARVYRSIEDGPLPGEPQWATDLHAKLSGTLDRYRRSLSEYPIRSLLGKAR